MGICQRCITRYSHSDVFYLLVFVIADNIEFQNISTPKSSWLASQVVDVFHLGVRMAMAKLKIRPLDKHFQALL